MATIVLVPGAWLGAWAFERVTPLLERRRHDVHALTLTGLGDRAHLASAATDANVHVQDVVAAIEMARLDEVVLVGHSYAGLVISGVAERIPERLARLVWLASQPAPDGQSLFEAFGPEFQGPVEAAAAQSAEGWRVPFVSDEQLDAYYGQHALSAADLAWLRERSVGHPLAVHRTRIALGNPRAAAVPRSFIHCTGDVHPPIEGALLLQTGHWPMVTAPDALADVLDRVASSAERAGGSFR
jgi:pimeloyl-ACP methyl ester carboxylesterase